MKSATLSVAVESLEATWGDIEPLLVEHYNEIAHDKDAIKLAPDRERYAAMERDGKLLFITCRADGVLIGYSAFFIVPHIHYAATIVAANDVLFVTKGMRQSRAGLMLIRESEVQAKARGAVKIVWHIKPEMDWSPIVAHRGCKKLEESWGKLL